jgi:hypothetical protein
MVRYIYCSFFSSYISIINLTITLTTTYLTRILIYSTLTIIFTERRNFWKNHPDVTSLCAVLLQFIEDTNRKVRIDGESMSPTRPSESKSSSRSPSHKLRNKHHNNNNNTMMRQIYGLNYFNREVTENELALHSRFFTFPIDGDDTAKALKIEEDMSEESQKLLTESRKQRNKTEHMKVSGNDLIDIKSFQSSTTMDSIQAKRAKHLNLAQHLVNYSSNPKCNANTMPLTSISTFVSVSDTQDPLTATCAIIALSNIASYKHVREYMIENNLMHRISNIIPVSVGPSSAMATSLYFYYFSCDIETEDRVYNAGGQYIAANGMIIKNSLLQIISLKTLVNLMPGGDRLRITESFMKIIHLFLPENILPSEFDIATYDRDIALEYLPLLLSVTTFTNTHSTLLACDIFDLLAKTSIYAKETNDIDIAILTSQILITFLQVQDHHVTHIISNQNNYIYSIEKLFDIKNIIVIKNCMHSIAIMSGVNEMCDNVRDSEILAVVSHTIFSWEDLEPSVAYDAACYYSNICQTKIKSASSVTNSTDNDDNNNNDDDDNYLRNLVTNDKLALSLMALIAKSSSNFKAQQVAIFALQNLLTIRENCIDLCSSVLPTLLYLIELHQDYGAAQCVYNISCIKECIPILKENQVHLKSLEYYVMIAESQSSSLSSGSGSGSGSGDHNHNRNNHSSSPRQHHQHGSSGSNNTGIINLNVKCTFLDIICQMFYDKDIINDVIRHNIIEKLYDTIQIQPSSVIDNNNNKNNVIEDDDEDDEDGITDYGSVYDDNGEIASQREAAKLWPIVVKIALNVVDHCKVLTEKQRILIVGILKVMCVEGSPDDIIGKSSVVMAYLSLTLEDFSEVDNVLRSILSLSHADLVIESVSTILYNLTCSSKNADLLLKDDVYINIMINIMRNGRPETQINIAKAMRTLCSMSRCIELLTYTSRTIVNSALSDYIVIAILKTSSEEIKVVCSEAFYNMLTHIDTRQSLLKGDLWWAITRICRTDCMGIRLAAAKALLDLSQEYETSIALRDHHILSFIQDLVLGEHDLSFIDILIKATQNLCNFYKNQQDISDKDKDNESKNNNDELFGIKKESTTSSSSSLSLNLFAPHEFISLVKICTDALSKCVNIDTIRGVLIIMNNISVQRVNGWDQCFLEDCELIDSLKVSINTWNKDNQCRDLIANLLWNLTTSTFICTHISLFDLIPIINATYIEEYGENYPSTCEYLLGVLDHYVTVPTRKDNVSNTENDGSSRPNSSSSTTAPDTPSHKQHETTIHEGCTPKEILKVDLIYLLIYDAFGVGETNGSNPYSLSCRNVAMTLLAYIVDDMDQKRLTTDIIQGIFNEEYMNNNSLRDNLMVIVHVLSQHANAAGYLIDSHIFTVLYNLTIKLKTTNIALIKYCSCCIRNIGQHEDLVPRLVETININKLITHILEISLAENVSLDISFFLYYCQKYQLKNHYIINSEYALDTCAKIMDVWKGEGVQGDNTQISKVCKLVIGEILEKYSEGIFIEPGFVDSMFNEMTNGNFKAVADYVDTSKPRQLNITPLFESKNKNKNDFIFIGKLLNYYVTTSTIDTGLWKPYLVIKREKMVTEMLDKSIIIPASYIKMIPAATRIDSKWSKVEETHERLGLPLPVEIDQYFSNEIFSEQEDDYDNEIDMQGSYGGDNEFKSNVDEGKEMI